jgi:hypothetical protein
MKASAARGWWAFLALLMLLVVWLCAAGNIVLHGLPASVLEALARGQALIPPREAARPDLLALLGRLPGDPVVWAAAATTLLNVAAAAVLLAAGMASWRNPAAALLAFGCAFFGAATLWVQSPGPWSSLHHLVESVALSALLLGAVPVMAGAVLALAVLSPAQALMMYLALAYLGYRRQAAYGLALPAVALFGVGCLLIPICSGYRLQPGLQGWQSWTALPLLLCLLPSSVRAARGGIYACLLIGSALTGSGELASTLALADMVFLASRSAATTATDQEASPTPPGSAFSAPLLIGLAATLLLIATILPGERYFNRHVLIAAQKAHLPFGQLFGFFSLRAHARQFAAEPWRARVPYPEMSAADFELALDLGARTLPQGLCPLTIDGERESRTVALLYALASQRPLRGWDSPDHLAGPLLLCKMKGRSFLSEGPEIVLRQGGKAELAVRPRPPAHPAPLDFRSVLVLPYRVQPVSRQAGAAYRWSGAGQVYSLAFTDQAAEMVLTARPGEYRISSPRGAVRHFEVPKLRWELSQLPTGETLPSRSLVPLKLRLANRGEGPIGSELISSWRLETTEGAAFSPFLQANPKSFILYPGEATELSLQLATPEAEGVYQVAATALSPEGEALPVPFAGAAAIRTWRRLPPVGTWVEEP